MYIFSPRYGPGRLLWVDGPYCGVRWDDGVTSLHRLDWLEEGSI